LPGSALVTASSRSRWPPSATCIPCAAGGWTRSCGATRRTSRTAPSGSCTLAISAEQTTGERALRSGPLLHRRTERQRNEHATTCPLPRVNHAGSGGKADAETRRRGGLRTRFSAQAAEQWKTFVLTPLRCNSDLTYGPKGAQSTTLSNGLGPLFASSDLTGQTRATNIATISECPSGWLSILLAKVQLIVGAKGRLLLTTVLRQSLLLV